MKTPVWFTRGLSETEVKAARKADIEPVVHPLIQIRFLPVQQVIRKTDELRKPDVLIFTSKNGVDAYLTCRVLKKRWLDDVPKYAVGDKTAEMLLQNGFKSVIAEEQTGKGLAEKVVEDFPNGAIVWHFCGNMSRPETGIGMSKPGFYYNPVICYETVELSKAGYPQEPYKAIVFYSPSAVRSYLGFNSDTEKGVAYVGIGPTTAKSLRDSGFKDVITPKKPSTKEIISVLKSEVLR